MNLKDLSKEVTTTIQERMASPFYGTLILSWCVWNWRILYLTFFVSESKLDVDKITYIAMEFEDKNHLYWYPLLSTLLLLTIIPFLSIGALWLSQWFEVLRNKIRDIYSKKKTIPLSQYNEVNEKFIDIREKHVAYILDNKSKMEDLKDAHWKEIKSLKDRYEVASADTIRNSVDFHDEVSKSFYPKFDLYLKEYQNNRALFESLYSRNILTEGVTIKSKIDLSVKLFYSNRDIIDSCINREVIEMVDEKQNSIKLTEKGVCFSQLRNLLRSLKLN